MQAIMTAHLRMESCATFQSKLLIQKAFMSTQHMAVCDAAGAQPGVTATEA